MRFRIADWPVYLMFAILAFVMIALACSKNNPGILAAMPTAVASPTLTINTEPTVTSSACIGKLKIPNRYIDWSAYVVCWYFESGDIDCMPISDTTLLGGQ